MEEKVFSQNLKLIKTYLSCRPMYILECPRVVPTVDTLCVASSGAQDCRYHGKDGGVVNCCCNECDIDMTCAVDSTTGSGLWKPLHPPKCREDGCGSKGGYAMSHIDKMKPLARMTMQA